MAGEGSPFIVLVNTGLAEKHGALLTVSSGLFLVAVFTAVLLGARHLLKQLLELQEVVDEEGRLVSRDTLVWLLAGLAAHRTCDTLTASLHLNGEGDETLVAEAV